MQQWEYMHAFGGLASFEGVTLPVIHVVNGSPLPTEQQQPVHLWLQQVGHQGWELITVVGTEEFRGFYLKRPKAGT